MMRSCEHCGENIADKRKICPYCNNKVSKVEIDIISEFSKSVSVMGLIFKDAGLLFEKETGKIANGYFCSYYKTFFGLLKSKKPVEAVHVIDGELVEMNDFNLYGKKRILYSKDWATTKVAKHDEIDTIDIEEVEMFDDNEDDIIAKGGALANKLLDPENPGGWIKSDIDEVFYKYDLTESNTLQFMEYIICITCYVNRRAWDYLGQEKADRFMDGFLFIIFKTLTRDKEEADAYFEIYNDASALYGPFLSLEKGYEFVEKIHEPIGMVAYGIIGMIEKDNSEQANKISNKKIKESLINDLYSSFEERIKYKINWEEAFS